MELALCGTVSVMGQRSSLRSRVQKKRFNKFHTVRLEPFKLAAEEEEDEELTLEKDLNDNTTISHWEETNQKAAHRIGKFTEMPSWYK